MIFSLVLITFWTISEQKSLHIHYMLFVLLRKCIIIYVIMPELRVITMSAIEKGIDPIGSKNKPVPYLKSAPPISISSPIYMTSVVSDAAMEGMIFANSVLFP